MVLLCVLVVELFTAGGLGQANSTLSILDMSGVTVLQDVGTELVMFADSVMQVIIDVNKFYVLAASEMTVLLQANSSDFSATANFVSIIIGGVNEFYNQASKEAMVVLDFSSNPATGNIAGSAIGNR